MAQVVGFGAETNPPAAIEPTAIVSYQEPSYLTYAGFQHEPVLGMDPALQTPVAGSIWDVPHIWDSADTTYAGKLADVSLYHDKVQQSDVALASYDGGVGDEYTGMGGPLEDATWPACRPGPGDDRCIQLYERGVPEAYAEWRGGDDAYAMGGPEEGLDMGKTGEEMGDAGRVMASADTVTKPVAMADASFTGKPEGDDMVTSARDATAVSMAAGSKSAGTMTAEMAAATNPATVWPGGTSLTAEQMQQSSAMTATGDASAYDGVGGPLEDADYPRCSATVTDSCQQGS